MSSFAAAASLIIATSELKVVSDVIGAIRAADLESGDVLTPSGIIEKPGVAPQPSAPPPIDRYDGSVPPSSNTIITRNLACCPPPSRCCTHRPINCDPLPRIIPTCDLEPAPTSAPTSPIEAPWKILPWMDRPTARIVLVPKIKLITASSDMSGRGRMLDVVV